MTYSVVARDIKTWHLGVAVQTHWFWVGNNVPWLEAWVWAIATQAQTNMDYGKKWLKLLWDGKSPSEVLKEISHSDTAFESRQVAMIDSIGNMIAHTGKDCIKYAWYLIWESFIVQGNILTNDRVLPAMKSAYEENIDTDFAERLYLCIKAWEEAWWELRWVQSAALRIVPWERDSYDIINLRIDDHTQPLSELKRQLDIQKAYNLLNDAEEEWITWDIGLSLKLFTQALTILPESEEILFWKAYMLKNKGRTEEAEEIFKKFWDNSKWGELRKRIS